MDSERFERALGLRDWQGNDALREFEALADWPRCARKKQVAPKSGNLFGSVSQTIKKLDHAGPISGTWVNPMTEFLDACLCAAEARLEQAVRKLTAFLETHTELKQSDDQDIYRDAQRD